MNPEHPPETEKKPSVGQALKNGRLKQRLSIGECAKRTHISQHYLEALEEERWDALPSESHRVGFLRLYARFLGVPSEEIITLYQRGRAPGEEAASPAAPAGRPRAEPLGRSATHDDSWYPGSWIQLVGLIIVLLVLAWGVYHVVRRQMPDQHGLPFVRLRPRPSARLVPVRQTVAVQKVRVHALSDSWLRVVTEGRLLFEGILPAGMTKEWTGPGPFDLKIGNVKGVALYWNDQPVDVQTTARGGMNELKLPLAK